MKIIINIENPSIIGRGISLKRVYESVVLGYL